MLLLCLCLAFGGGCFIVGLRIPIIWGFFVLHFLCVLFVCLLFSLFIVLFGAFVCDWFVCVLLFVFCVCMFICFCVFCLASCVMSVVSFYSSTVKKKATSPQGVLVLLSLLPCFVCCLFVGALLKFCFLFFRSPSETCNAVANLSIIFLGALCYHVSVFVFSLV